MLKILDEQCGQVAVLAALFMVVLLGMSALVIDVGFLFVTKTQLQTSADAGALAGADDLNNANPATAASTATSYAKMSPGQSTDTVVIVITNTSSTRQVQVTTSRVVTYFFAQVFGYTNSTVTATATAAVFPAGSVPSATPFVIEAPQDIVWQGVNNQYSQPYTMEINPVGKTDHFTYVDVVFNNPTSTATYYSLLTTGNPNSTTLNTQLYYVAPAEGGQKSVQSFTNRISNDSNSNIANATVGEPRLMMIPLVQTLPTSQQDGSDWSYSTNGLAIVGFVGFWLDSVYYGPLTYVNGSPCYKQFNAQGRFIKVALPSGSSNGFGTQFFGPGQVSLIK
jgi:Flp pilus assembly protein TadG